MTFYVTFPNEDLTSMKLKVCYCSERHARSVGAAVDTSGSWLCNPLLLRLGEAYVQRF